MKKHLAFSIAACMLLFVSCVSAPQPEALVSESPAPPAKEASLVELVVQGNQEGLKNLFKGREQVNSPDKNGLYPVHLAVANGKSEMLEILLSMGANPDSQDAEGRTALHYAVDKQDKTSAAALVKNGASIFIKSKAGISPLDAAIAKDFSPALITSKSANSRGSKGETALQVAVSRLSMNAVRNILSFSPDINAVDNEGRSALDQAFLYPGSIQAATIAELLVSMNAGSSIDVFSYFIKAAKDTNYSKARFGDGATVLHEAVRNNHIGFLAFFLSRNVPVDAKTTYGSTALQEAVSQSRIEAVKLLLEAGADPDIKDSEGRSSLHNAFYTSREMAELLLQSKANAALKDKYGNTVLHLAVSLGFPQETLLKIIDKPLPLDAINSAGDTALNIAVKQKRLPIVELLASKGSSLFVKNEKGENPLTIAMLDGEEITKSIITAASQDIRDEQGEGPYHYAVRIRAGADIIGVLKDLGLDVSAKSNNGDSALHLACQYNAEAEGLALLKAGADPYIVNSQGICPVNLALNAKAAPQSWFFTRELLNSADAAGNNPLHYAAMEANIPGLEFLVNAGISINSPNKDGQTPLMLVIKKDSTDSLVKLLSMGADPGLRDNTGSTVLHLSVYWQAKECLKFLAESGKNLNLRDFSGKTALRTAIEKTDPFSVAYLLERGADPLAADNFGKTAFHAAARLEDERFLKALMSKTSRIDTRDNSGTTPLLEAVYSGKSRTARFLAENGASLFARDASGESPLSYTAKKNLPLLESFLSSGSFGLHTIHDKPVLSLLLDTKPPLEVIKLAVKTGVPLNERDTFGRTPLYLAVESGRQDIAEYLVAMGADRFMADYQGRSPASLAFSASYNMIAGIFGSEPNASDFLGETALHYAAASGQEKAVEALLALGADPSLKNNAGEKPSDTARRRAYLSIVKLLEK